MSLGCSVQDAIILWMSMPEVDIDIYTIFCTLEYNNGKGSPHELSQLTGCIPVIGVGDTVPKKS